MVIYSDKMESKFLFSFQFSVKDSELYFDYENKAIRISWDGRVDEETATGLIQYAMDLIEGKAVNRILFDRRKLIHFSDPARAWFHNEVDRGRWRQLKDAIERIAIVNELSVAAQLFGHHNNDHITDAYAGIPYQHFDKMPAAEEWLLH